MLSELVSRWLRPNDGNPFRILHRGRTFLIPARGAPDHILDGMRKRQRFYEADLLNALSTMLAGREGAVFDIGANIGNHTLFFSAVMDRPVFSFEPIPDNQALLGRMIALNNLSDKVTALDYALGSAPGSLEMYTPDAANPGCYRFVPEGQKGELSVPIQMLDAVAEDLLDGAPLALMKIDVEGAEDQVIAGAAQVIARHKPVLVLETNGAQELARYCDSLGALGYVPVSVHCATPTVIFAIGMPDARDAIERRLVSRDAKQSRRMSESGK